MNRPIGAGIVGRGKCYYSKLFIVSLEWRWGVVSYGRDQHLGTGWFVTVSQTPAEVCL